MSALPNRASDDGDAVALGHKDPATDEQRHRQRLDEATHTIPCPTCLRRGIQSCPQCFGTTLIPATLDEWERNELEEVADDLYEFCLERLEKVERWERLATAMRAVHHVMMAEIKNAKRGGLAA